MGEVQTVNVTMPVAKETKEVIDLLGAVYDFVKAKKGLNEIGSLFSELSIAVAGIDKIGDEAKSQYRDETAGYMVHILMEKLMPVKPEVK